MKLKHTLAVLGLGLAMLALPYRMAACTAASFTGPYGFALKGMDGSTVTAVVGQMTSDGKGKITSGTETVSAGGAITSNALFTGTYSLSSNCIGILTVSPSGLPTAHFKITVVSTGNQVEMVESDTGTGVFGYALARGNSVCTLAGTKATYGFQGGGSESPSIATAFEGQFAFNGAGTLSGTETASAGGRVISGAIKGTYQINSDCTGSSTITLSGDTETGNFVVVNGGLTLLAITTNSGAVQITTVNKR
jgi:hypothetical protein